MRTLVALLLALPLALASPLAHGESVAKPRQRATAAVPSTRTLPPKPAAEPDAEAKRAKVRARLRALRAARLVEILDLDEATAARLVAVFQRYDSLLDPLRLEARTAKRALGALVRQGVTDGAKLTPLVDRLTTARAKIDALKAQLLTDARAILSPIQAAKLVLVLPEIDRRLARGVRKAAGEMHADDDAAADDFQWFSGQKPQN